MDPQGLKGRSRQELESLMKLHEVKKPKAPPAVAPKDGEHPIMYDLIRHWLDQGKRVIVDSADYVMLAKALTVDLQRKETPQHGEQRTYKLTYQGYNIPRGSKVPVLSAHVEDTWMYPAELEDAKVVEKDDETVKVWTPNYLNDITAMKDRK
jgi:hypothetical protein